MRWWLAIALCTMVQGAASADATVSLGSRSTSSMARVTVAQLRALLGRPASSPLVRNFLAQLATEREVSTFSNLPPRPHERHVHFSYKREGLSVLFVDDRIETIFLFAQGADQFDAWPGELPKGLTFRDTRAAVEAKVGKPTKSGGDGVINFWADYGGGVHVTYDDKSTTSPTIRMHHVALVHPEP